MDSVENTNNSVINDKNTNSHHFREFCVRILRIISLFPIFTLVILFIVLYVVENINPTTAEIIEHNLVSHFPRNLWGEVILFLPFAINLPLLAIISNKTPSETRNDSLYYSVLIIVIEVVTLILSALGSGWLGVVAWAFAMLSCVSLMVGHLLDKK